MKLHSYQNIDSVLRVLFSKIYRGIILTYALYIVFTDVQNYFGLYDYVAFSTLYILFYWLLRRGEGWLSVLRLLNDYVFIFLVLYQKEIFDIKHVIFCFIPLFNYANHSQIKRQPILPYVFSALLIFILKYPNIKFSDFFPFLFLIAIDFFEHFRTRVYHLKNVLLRELDSFLIQNIDIKNTSGIYDVFIKYLNHSKLSNIIKIYDVICLAKRGDAYRLVNSHKFIFSIKLDVKQFEKRGSFNYCDQISIILNDVMYDDYIGIMVDTKQNGYIFLLRVSVENKIVHALLSSYLYENFVPAFIKIANYIEASQDIKAANYKMTEQVKSTMGYINDTVFALHFVRNKLNPLVNYFTMTEEMKSINQVDVMSFYDRKLQEEEIRANESLKLIVNRTNSVLEISKNPTFISGTEPMALSTFVTMLRALWLLEFHQESFEILVSDEFWQKSVSVDSDALEGIFVDIISNIKKYRNLTCKLEVSTQDRHLHVRFSNDVRPDGNKIRALRVLAHDFTTSKILTERQSTHGLTYIKTFLNQMKVESSMHVTDNQLTTTLKFSVQ